MSGAFIDIEVTGMAHAQAVFNRLGSASLGPRALEALGGLVEMQTRDRFSTKEAPDGSKWAPWSPAYAATRGEQHSLLLGMGALRDSIAWRVSGMELSVGSNLVYAAIHQMGSDETVTVKAHTRTSAFGRPTRPYEVGEFQRQMNMPARPFLGVSNDNETEIVAALTAWVNGVVGGAA